jgi:DNA polymerase III delta subunit
MIIFILAKDEWRARERKNELILSFKKNHPEAIINVFDLEENNNIESFSNFLENQSLFEKEKLSIVYNLFSSNKKELGDKIKKILFNKNIYVLIYEKNTPSKQFNFLLKKPVIYEKFEILTGKDFYNFALKEAKKRNLNLTPSALNFLIQFSENNSFKLITELEKISFLNNKQIDLKDLNNLGIEIQPDFWLLINQLKNPDLKLRMEAFEKILNFKEPLGKIFNILAYSSQKIENFAIYDRAIKSGKLDYDEALLDFIL